LTHRSRTGKKRKKGGEGWSIRSEGGTCAIPVQRKKKREVIIRASDAGVPKRGGEKKEGSTIAVMIVFGKGKREKCKRLMLPRIRGERGERKNG